MLTRGELKKIYPPDPESQASEFSLEQRLAGKATNAGVWFKISFFLVANVFTNSFSLNGLLEENVPTSAIMTLCAVLGMATIYANFISKTVVVCNPIEPLKLDTKLKRLYERLDTQIKLSKEYSNFSELHLVIDDAELLDLSKDKINLPTIGGEKSKFEVVMQLLANRYGRLILQSPRQVLTAGNQGRPNVVVALTAACSADMFELIALLPPETLVFNYDSFWEGQSAQGKYLDAAISIPRWIFIKGLPSLVLLNQGTTTTISLLNKIPGFNNALWYLQIGSVTLTAGLINWARIIVNNILKGDRAILEATVLKYRLEKFVRSFVRKNDGIANQAVSQANLQVNYAKAVGIVIVALASVGFTVYYNYTNAKFYSPEQAVNGFLKQLQVIPGIENTPDWLQDIGKFFRDSESYLSYGQVISALVLSFLTSCKSTLDRSTAWLYKPANQSKSFCEKPLHDQLFVTANAADSFAFGTNATFNVIHTGGGLEVGLLTGLGIYITNIIWGLDTKNTKIAHAIVRSGSMRHLHQGQQPSESLPQLPVVIEEENDLERGENISPVSAMLRQPLLQHGMYDEDKDQTLLSIATSVLPDSPLHPSSIPVESPDVRNARSTLGSFTLSPKISSARNSMWQERSERLLSENKAPQSPSNSPLQRLGQQ